jgi:glycosyltransferase involved in cell wall biosynthesis
MKIVFVSLFRDEESGGGEGRVAHEMAHHFAAHHDTVLMCPDDETGLWQAQDGLKILGVRSAGEGSVYFPALTGRNVNRIFAVLDRFDPDVVHAHEPASIGLIAQIWARMHDVPFVHTAHVLPSRVLDFGAVEVVKILRGSLSESVAQQMLSNFYENCDAVIALNRPGADSFRRFGYEGRLLVIPNGRDLRRYGTCENADLLLPEKTLTFVGWVSERKNQRYLLEVLRHLPGDYRLQIVGEPLDPAYELRLREFAADYNLTNVVFTGHVEHDNIPDYLERTHVFVSASKMEVQSLVVIEALASGTPVVGLSNETVDELVDDAVGCRLPKDAEPEEFARCVRGICDLPQSEYERMCERARERVARLDWAKVVAMTVEAYESLLREKGEVKPAAGEREARLRRTISLMPPGEVRDLLMEQVTVLERAIQGRIAREPKSTLAKKIKRARRVPGSSWFYVGLTALVSGIGYLLLRYMSSEKWTKKPEVSG